MNELNRVGFTYLVETLVDGQVTSTEIVRNLMPEEGLNHALSVLLKGGAQNPSWYLGLYEGAYTPNPDLSDTAAAFPSTATESTAYTETNRVLFNSGSVADATVNNSANRAEFTMNADKTIYGGFMTSAPAKGATTGVLLSVVRFASPKVLQSGSVLRVTAGITFASA